MKRKYFFLCSVGILVLLLLTLPLIRSDKSGPTEQFIAVCDTFFADPEAHSIRTGTGEDFTEEFYRACLPLYERGDYDAIYAYVGEEMDGFQFRLQQN